MLQTLLRVGRQLTTAVPYYASAAPTLLQCSKVFPGTCHNSMKFGSLCSTIAKQHNSLLFQPTNVPLCEPPTRTVTKFSLQKGKRKTVKAVVKRFFRLHWGGWIRTVAGRHKKMWKKSAKRRHRLKQHLLCNSTQSYLLDKMVTKFWRTPKYYVEDPYEPYHTREEHPIARRKPA
ncbi:hypothetical protein R5R35_010133 [Gryllus longicercus]|uniref:Large ribosomal subunit protein bL35m n=1 Tax=Gryllus longicercus TaxID=2509291 RepID=A0AAN9Z4R9_9ORTH